MAKSGDISSRLYEWATKEMQFRPPPSCPRMPTADDFRLLTRGHMTEVWKYIVQNTVSVKTLTKIRGNLKLNKQRESFAALEAENEEKSLKVKKLQLEIEHLEKDLKQMKQQILYTEGELTKNNAELLNQKKKTVLLQEFSAQVNEQMKICNYLEQEVLKKMMVYDKMQDSQKPVYYSSNSVSKVETACQKAVRECIERIQVDLNQMNLPGRPLRQRTLDNCKESWQQKLDPILLKFSAFEIIDALVKVTLESVQQLKEKTTQIDIKQDVAELKSTFERPGAPSLLQSVHQLITEGHRAHLCRFMETEKLANRTREIRQQMQNLQNTIDMNLEEIFSEDPEKLATARELMNLELQNVIHDAALECIEEQSSRLKTEINKADVQKEILQKKHEQIQTFESVVQRKNDKIKQLRKTYLQSQKQLENSHRQVFEYARSSFCSHYPNTQCLVEKLSHFVAAEAERFSLISLPHLMMAETDEGEKVPLMDLSINQLNPDLDTTAQKTLYSIMAHLQIPIFMAPEYILVHCSKLKAAISQAESSRQLTLVAAESPVIKTADLEAIQHIQDLIKELGVSEEMHLKQCDAKLQEELKKAEANLASCAMLKHRLDEWEHQPAQYCVPWIKVNDLTFDQWKERWTVASTQLRTILQTHSLSG